MPWQETCVRNERTRFVVDWERKLESMAELCRRYGVSRRTGYKWLQRYQQQGWAGWEDRSRAPRRHPLQTAATIEQEILALWAQHTRWGAITLQARLQRAQPKVAWPAVSTIGNLPRRRRRRASPTPPPLTAGNEPNRVWCADFKGWFRTQDGERCDPLTISDAASRYLLRCQAVTKPDGEHVQPLFEATFREFGLPRVLRTDNGPPFATLAVHGLSRLAVWWIKLGIYPERIEPGHPEQNGRHERMHRTLKQETASPPAANLRAQQRALDRFRQDYNEERPHQGLQLRTPSECYQGSGREYLSRLEEPEYPTVMEVRRVLDGRIRWRRQRVYVGKGLNGERVGLEAVGEGLWRVWFCFYELGLFDERELCLRPGTGPAAGHSSRDGTGLRLPSGLPESSPIPGREVLPMCLA